MNIPVAKDAWVGNHEDIVQAFRCLEQHDFDAFSGDVESPTGWFAMLSFLENEVDQVNALLDEHGLDILGFRLKAGHYIFVQDNDGNCGVYEYDSKQKMLDTFNELHAEYEKWDSPEEEEEDEYPTVWLDMKSGTFGTSQIVTLNFKTLGVENEDEFFDEFSEMSDESRIYLGKQYGVEIFRGI